MAEYTKDGATKFTVSEDQELILLENGWVKVEEKKEEKPKKKGE